MIPSSSPLGSCFFPKNASIWGNLSNLLFILSVLKFLLIRQEQKFPLILPRRQVKLGSENPLRIFNGKDLNRKKKEMYAMANSNRVIVPAARAALDQFKMEAANEVGVNLKQGYNGDLTSKQAGSIGGQMVKKMRTVRTANYTRKDRTAVGHEIEVRYIAGIVV